MYIIHITYCVEQRKESRIENQGKFGGGGWKHFTY